MKLTAKNDDFLHAGAGVGFMKTVLCPFLPLYHIFLLWGTIGIVFSAAVSNWQRKIYGDRKSPLFKRGLKGIS